MPGIMTESACPKCGGDMWDNRATKKNPKQPDFKCKDKTCDGVIWPPRNATAPAAHAPAPKSVAPASAYVGDLPGDPGAGSEFAGLCEKYKECVQYVVGHITPIMMKEIGTDPQSVASMVATLFIARQNKGV